MTSTPTDVVSYRATRLTVEVGRNLARFRERYEHAVPPFPALGPHRTPFVSPSLPPLSITCTHPLPPTASVSHLYPSTVKSALDDASRFMIVPP